MMFIATTDNLPLELIPWLFEAIHDTLCHVAAAVAAAVLQDHQSHIHSNLICSEPQVCSWCLGASSDALLVSDHASRAGDSAGYVAIFCWVVVDYEYLNQPSMGACHQPLCMKKCIDNLLIMLVPSVDDLLQYAAYHHPLSRLLCSDVINAR